MPKKFFPIIGVLASTALFAVLYLYTYRTDIAPPMGYTPEATANSSTTGVTDPIEVLPFNGEILNSAGTRDFSNEYSPTVMVTTQEPLKGAECSGVIIAPRVVLTAGHCVCGLKSDEIKSTIIDKTKCADQAHAVLVVYGTVRSKMTADFQLHIYNGLIRPHPELKLVVDDKGSIISSNADLAVIVLNDPVGNGISSIPLADTEVQLDESLVMAGYGHDKNVGSIYGTRYFRKNRIKKIESSSDRFIYEQKGAYVYDGFSGGPCFRESATNRWLVGISSASTDQELSFTSTLPHRDWIRSEIQRAGK